MSEGISGRTQVPGPCAKVFKSSKSYFNCDLVKTASSRIDQGLVFNIKLADAVGHVLDVWSAPIMRRT